MNESGKILFVSQEIFPYLTEETPIRVLNRQMPEFFQANGFETRTFMPKFGAINERRNQLHEVIRLSGMNLVIEDTDHSLLIKVASIPAARIQIYFIDNDDYFLRRKGTYVDEKGKEYADNDERTIFFARGVIETIKKLRWTPNIVYCSGWMAALMPLYLKKVYNKTAFFANAKIVLALDEMEYTNPFGTHFSDKLRIDGLLSNDMRSIAGFPVGYEELMRLAVDNADAIVVTSEHINQRVLNYAEQSGKPMLNSWQSDDMHQYLDFCKTLL